jgi:hypothetical protein
MLRWLGLLKQQMSITVYHLPTKETKLLHIFHFLFAENKRKLPFSVSSVFIFYIYIN